MKAQKISYIEVVNTLLDGRLLMEGLEEHKRFFKFRTLEAAAKDLYSVLLVNKAERAKAKKLGLPIPD